MAVSQTLKLTQVSQSAEDNTSRVRILWQSTQSGDSYNANTRTAKYYVSINGGAETEYSVSYTLPKKSTVTILDVTVTVAHTDEGVGSIKVRTWMDTRISAGEVELSKSLSLTDIPRASTIGASDANIGANSTIVVTRKSSAYTHSIAYKFGSLSGYITAAGGVSASEVKFSASTISWTVPAAFYAQIPDAKSGVCALTIKTYSGSTQIGAAQTATFVATAARSACAPSVSAVGVDINETTIALTGSNTRIVRGVSNVQVDTVAAAQNGASIVSVTAVCGTETLTGESVVFSAAQSAVIKVTAVDSRGYSTTVQVSGLTLVDYFKPTLIAQIARISPTSDTVRVEVYGQWYNGGFGATDNTLTVDVRYKLRSESEYTNPYTTVTLTHDGNAYTGTVDLAGTDYQQAYSFRVRARDMIYTHASPVFCHREVSKGIPVYDWGESDFAVNVLFQAKLGTVVGLANDRYVGTEDNDETALESWLETLLDDLPVLSVKSVAWSCHPAITGATVCSQLYRHSDTAAVLFGWSYNGYIYLKSKENGVWANTVKYAIT